MNLADVIMSGCLQGMQECDAKIIVMSPLSRKQHRHISKYYYPLGKWDEKTPPGEMNLAGLHNGHYLLQEFVKYLQYEHVIYCMDLTLRPKR